MAGSRITPPPPTAENGRHAGRPRDPRLEARVLETTLELISKGGLRAATIDAVAERSGVARATIYRRWTDHDGLLGAAIRHSIGREPLEPTGDLEADMGLGTAQAHAITAEAMFVAVFPEIARELLQGDRASARLTYDGLFPGRRALAEEYRDLAGTTGLRTDIDPYVAVDLIVGAQVMHLLATGQSPSPEFANQVLDVVLAGLRATSREAG